MSSDAEALFVCLNIFRYFLTGEIAAPYFRAAFEQPYGFEDVRVQVQI